MNTNQVIDSKQKPSLSGVIRRSGFCITLIVGSLINAFVMIFIAPKFGDIFHDMLGGKPLPPVTSFILEYHMVLAALSMALPVIGVMFCLFASSTRAFVTLCVLTLVTFVQIAVTVFALFMPLIGTVQTLGNS
ncbi:MAG: hypothetical protein WCD79_10900 [Chthoniobacteraceae bacterium]